MYPTLSPYIASGSCLEASGRQPLIPSPSFRFLNDCVARVTMGVLLGHGVARDPVFRADSDDALAGADTRSRAVSGCPDPPRPSGTRSNQVLLAT